MSLQSSSAGTSWWDLQDVVPGGNICLKVFATSQSGNPSPTPTSTPTASPTPSASLATLTPEDETNPNTQYLLTVEMDYARHHLAVEEQIAYTNRSDEPIPDLLLIVEPTRYPAVFHLKSLSWLDGQPVEDYQQDIGQLRIPLSRPLPPGEGLTLLISYELYLPSPDPTYYGRPVPFGYSPRQANLVDWYPERILYKIVFDIYLRLTVIPKEISIQKWIVELALVSG